MAEPEACPDPRRSRQLRLAASSKGLRLRLRILPVFFQVFEKLFLCAGSKLIMHGIVYRYLWSPYLPIFHCHMSFVDGRNSRRYGHVIPAVWRASTAAVRPRSNTAGTLSTAGTQGNTRSTFRVSVNISCTKHIICTIICRHKCNNSMLSS